MSDQVRKSWKGNRWEGEGTRSSDHLLQEQAGVGWRKGEGGVQYDGDARALAPEGSRDRELQFHKNKRIED